MGVSDQTVRRWIKAGKLVAYKPGKEFRVSEGDLEQFLQSRRSESPKAQAPPENPENPSGGAPAEERDKPEAVAARNIAARWNAERESWRSTLPEETGETNLGDARALLQWTEDIRHTVIAFSGVLDEQEFRRLRLVYVSAVGLLKPLAEYFETEEAFKRVIREGYLETADA